MPPVTATFIVLAGLATVIVTWHTARRGVGPREQRVFEAVNGWPDRWYGLLATLMQFGTYVTTPVVAAAVAIAGRHAEAIVIVVSGTAAWAGAKLLKAGTRRGRPRAALAQTVRIRGHAQSGGGFPSGHAATSASLSVTLGAVVGGWWWPPLLMLAVLTGLGRVYIGAHLPLDVLGGAGLGAAIAGLGLLIAVGLG